MKRVLKGGEPTTLTGYRNAVPQGTWDAMRADAHYGGQQAYQDCRCELIKQQKGLCAYCEIDIRDNDPLKCRIEHFHPKSNITPHHNWALDWQNMLGVCNGGSYEYIGKSGLFLEPMDKNLSCDAHKDKMIQSGRLAAQCAGWILNSVQLAAFPTLFVIEKSTGKILPDASVCANHQPIQNNRHASTEALVKHTIDMLNLNCDRLAQARLRVIWDVERNKKKEREKGVTPQQGLANLAQYYFSVQWKGFFTTIRLCLGQPADAYLQSINFQG